MRNRFIKISLVATVALSLGCQPVAIHSNSPDNLEAEGLFLTRYMSSKVHTKMYQLTHPALLETAFFKDGKYSVNTVHADAIATEQRRFLNTLKQIAPATQLVYTYRMVLNAIAISGTFEEHALLEKLPQIKQIEISQKLSLHPDVSDQIDIPLSESNPIKLIGAEEVHGLGYTGKGIRIGVVDSGVDYTHKMLGGPGTEEAYLSVSVENPTPLFPNKKVVGGIDLLGDLGSISPLMRDEFIPIVDTNPLDELGHGTHVAATIAGVGDGVNSYSGVAPDANLHGIKGTTRDGFTYDYIIIKALEYSADPNEDLDLSDKLQVLNLSLGNDAGVPYTLMNSAIDNLTKTGTFIVAAVGNQGASAYMVSTPASNANTISVAASQYEYTMEPAVSFANSKETFYTIYREANGMLPGYFFDELKGDIYLWYPDNSSEQELSQLKNKIVLLTAHNDQYENHIIEAVKHGALAIIIAEPEGKTAPYKVVRNQPIPGAIISHSDAQKIIQMQKIETVVADLVSSKNIKHLVNTMADFSSRGPRPTDGLLKPEITAPGVNILSALMGTGDMVDTDSGTSMAAPIISGAMALLIQKYPNKNIDFYKSLLMGQSDILLQDNGQPFPLVTQGAGQVNVMKSINAQLVSLPASISLGLQDLSLSNSRLSHSLKLTNISDKPLSLNAELIGDSAIQMRPFKINLAAGSTKKITVLISLNEGSVKTSSANLEGRIFLRDDNGETILHIPVIAVAHKSKGLTINESVEHINFKNQGDILMQALPFIKFGEHKQKPRLKGKMIQDAGCDLKQAGYRVVHSKGKNLLQIAFETRDLQTNWHKCETSIQLDTNKDGIADYEATNHVHFIPGVATPQLMGLLFDGNEVRKIQQAYLLKEADNEFAMFDYAGALIDNQPFIHFDHNRYAILQFELEKVPQIETARVKVSTSHQSNGSSQMDAFINNQDTWFEPQWKLSSPTFTENTIDVSPRSQTQRTFTKDSYMFVTSSPDKP